MKLSTCYKKVNKSKIIIRDFITLLSGIDRTRRQKISQYTEDLNNTINQVDLKYIYKTFCPTNNTIHILLNCTQNIH